MSDLDLRELQKSGRIGRIEVTIEAEEGVSSGQIIIPSSLTRKETALLAATIETVSRVGPCSASVKLEAINDIREDKRKQIIERATELLKEWDEKTPEPREIEEQISQDIRVSEVQKWGPDNLPSGPEMEESQDLLIVEGNPLNDIKAIRNTKIVIKDGKVYDPQRLLRSIETSRFSKALKWQKRLRMFSNLRSNKRF